MHTATVVFTPRHSRRFHRQPVMRPSWQRCGQQENQSWPRRRRRLFHVLSILPHLQVNGDAGAERHDEPANVFPSNYCVYTWDLPGNLPVFRDNSRLPLVATVILFSFRRRSRESSAGFSSGSKLNGNHARISPGSLPDPPSRDKPTRDSPPRRDAHAHAQVAHTDTPSGGIHQLSKYSLSIEKFLSPFFLPSSYISSSSSSLLLSYEVGGCSRYSPSFAETGLKLRRKSCKSKSWAAK